MQKPERYSTCLYPDSDIVSTEPRGFEKHVRNYYESSVGLIYHREGYIAQTLQYFANFLLRKFISPVTLELGEILFIVKR